LNHTKHDLTSFIREYKWLGEKGWLDLSHYCRPRQPLAAPSLTNFQQSVLLHSSIHTMLKWMKSECEEKGNKIEI
jgi:hypothetical protein